MYQICIYDPLKDKCEVDQFGFVDMVSALDTGYIPSEISDTSEAYNDIDDPSSIMGKPRDPFEAMRMQDYLHSVGSEQEVDKPE